MTKTSDVLTALGASPYHGRGQHFLTNRNIAQRIVDITAPGPESVVVEIGPGTGALTDLLTERAGRVIAIESDRKLACYLTDAFRDRAEIVFGDALSFDYRELGKGIGASFLVVANLPYNISTELIFRLLDVREHVERMVLMLQKEVAQRLVAKPGTKEYGVLTVLVTMLCDVSTALSVGPGNFHPRPKVDSRVVVFDMLRESRVPVKDMQLFRRVVRASFGTRRKTLRNALRSLSDIIERDALSEIEGITGLDFTRRGETLTIGEFAIIADTLHDILHPDAPDQS
ncbi:MAG: ribosomal RNA small subunit methyltransferase A [Deltaproteobacteria bacterium]|nr:ribosomal RNA small subunit methyltransferase A [Candidatus Zymogenaceae bacterium]